MEPKQRRPPLQRKGLQHCTYMEGVKPKQFLADTDVALPLLRPQRNDAVKMPSNDARLNELEAPMQWRLDQRHILQVIACITNAMGRGAANVSPCRHNYSPPPFFPQ
ncbi:hypothetical protein PC129_g10389 [Phytophthora cactorum]|uniref:Uncharacterized protein n=1 Tax=Phytophthora cactorum TaxID=29920 RepID=A0A8T1I0S7_9STRA|nr:hypothetical protein Pcac1_g2523 [Phytophthora cactorum]KAG2900037.1 hypothetical protein PC114_g13673 [Phytophthora cactorum]KAG2918284.1 hypothetical protein PC115_g10484 [Phytophthora cactorum]KAG3060452.1 hypothetical protein PC121_g13467 [Phytophthora cactorum]KAG3078858.1 hypothetical protein PC122_g12490 [Phytophthora cactorum]